VLGDETDAGAEANSPGDGRRGSEGDVWIQRPLVLLGELRLPGRRRSPATHGNVGVLRHVDRSKAPRLGLDREVDGAHGLIRGEEGDPDLHAALP
jgi:hypothetical protein